MNDTRQSAVDLRKSGFCLVLKTSKQICAHIRSVQTMGTAALRAPTPAQTAYESTDGILLQHDGRGDSHNDANDKDNAFCAHGIAPAKEVGGPIPSVNVRRSDTHGTPISALAQHSEFPIERRDTRRPSHTVERHR